MSLATCTLTIDGRPITSDPSQVGIAPAALDSARVTWGRADAITQPTAATATVELLLPYDDAAALTSITVGHTLALDATVHTPSGSRTIVPSTMGLPTDGTYTGTQLSPTMGALNAPVVYFPPADLTVDDPAAWDAIPQAHIGEHWTVSITVSHIPVGCTVHLAPVYYRTPSGSKALGPWLTAFAAEDQSGSHRLTAAVTVTLPAAWGSAWIGLAVQVRGWDTWRRARGGTDPTWTDYDTTWGDIRYVNIGAPAALAPARIEHVPASVFSGRISDTALSWDSTTNLPLLKVTASDLRATLANRRLGAEPWPVQTMERRVQAILDDVNRSGATTDLAAIIDPTPAARLLAPLDVDSQSADDLLTSAATSAGAILWCTTHRLTGPYLRLEDPADRMVLNRLILPADETAPATTSVITTRDTIPASVLLRDDVTLTQSPDHVSSVVRVRWAEQGIDDEGKPTTTDRTVETTDASALTSIGYRSTSVSTNLVRLADAEALADMYAALTSPGGWVLSSLTWDTSVNPGAADPSSLADLLDATRRMGLPITITDLAQWVPGSPTLTAYVDGGTLTYKAGRWVIDLTLTRTDAIGRSITWGQSPPALTWTRTTALTWREVATITI